MQKGYIVIHKYSLYARFLRDFEWCEKFMACTVFIDWLVIAFYVLHVGRVL
jgi:hypothetical protein